MHGVHLARQREVRGVDPPQEAVGDAEIAADHRVQLLEIDIGVLERRDELHLREPVGGDPLAGHRLRLAEEVALEEAEPGRLAAVELLVALDPLADELHLVGGDRLDLLAQLHVGERLRIQLHHVGQLEQLGAVGPHHEVVEHDDVAHLAELAELPRDVGIGGDVAWHLEADPAHREQRHEVVQDELARHVHEAHPPADERFQADVAERRHDRGRGRLVGVPDVGPVLVGGPEQELVAVHLHPRVVDRLAGDERRGRRRRARIRERTRQRWRRPRLEPARLRPAFGHGRTSWVKRLPAYSRRPPGMRASPFWGSPVARAPHHVSGNGDWSQAGTLQGSTAVTHFTHQ